jgi:hypothetical protein
MALFELNNNSEKKDSLFNLDIALFFEVLIDTTLTAITFLLCVSPGIIGTFVAG